MKRQMRYKILSSVILILLSIPTWALSDDQTDPPPPPPATKSATPPPPPPGLPIDQRGYLLFIAGLGLGIYLLRSKKTA